MKIMKGKRLLKEYAAVAAIFMALVVAQYTRTLPYLSNALLLFFAGFAFAQMRRKNIRLAIDRETILSTALSLALAAAAYACGVFAPLGSAFPLPGCLALFMAFLIIFRYLYWAIPNDTRLFVRESTAERRDRFGWKYALPILIASVFVWSLRYPSGTSADTISQWRQIHGEYPFSSVHAVGHTLFLKALIMIKDSYSIVILVQILMFFLLFGAMFSYFQKKGVHPYLLWLISLAAAFHPTFLDIIVCPYKDNPYTICVILITFALIRMVLDKGELSLFWRISLGISIAGAWLMRHNGILVFFGALLVTLYSCFHYSLRKYLPVLVISIATVLCVNFIAFDLMGAVSQNDGTPYAIFGDGIVSVVMNNGNVTDEQMERIEKIFPMEFVEKYYRWGEGRRLLWSEGYDGPEGYGINPYRMALRLHSKEIIGLYLELLPRNIPVMAYELAGSTRRIWAVTKDLFADHSFELALILIGLCLLFRFPKLYWLPFLPVFLNIVSIAISATTNEDRYLMPTSLLFLILAVYAGMVCQRTGRKRIV